MVFTPDTRTSLKAAIDLVNTESTPGRLDTVADLDAFYARWDYTGSHARTRKELDEVRALRPQLRQLLTSERSDLVALINAILREAIAVPQLVRHDGLDWHIHATSDDEPLARRILVEAAMALIDVLRADELDRISRCDAKGCPQLVIDLSRNRSRRFCSAACGNRIAAVAYRVRRKR